MTPTEFRHNLHLMNMSQRGFARLISFPEGLVRAWARGKIEIPHSVADEILQITEAIMNLSEISVNYLNRP